MLFFWSAIQFFWFAVQIYLIRMISRSLILQILQTAKIMRRFFYEAPAEIMRIYTTGRQLRNRQFIRERT